MPYFWRERDRLSQLAREAAAGASPVTWRFEPSIWDVRGPMIFVATDRIPDQNGDGVPEVGLRFREDAAERGIGIAWCIALDGASGQPLQPSRKD